MIPTPIPIKNKQINFKLKSDNNKEYDITFLNTGITLVISSFHQEDVSKINYESEFDLDYIKKVKLFIIYDTIDECLNEIIPGINSGKSEIIENNNFLILSIPLNNFKFKEITFKLNKEEKIDKDKINELYSIIKEQKQEIDYLKNEINNMNNIIKELLMFKEEITKEKFCLTKKDDIFFDSKIIADNINYINLLKTGISPNKIKKTEILYRLTEDGDSVNTFHSLCDGISPTIVLVESSKGYKFGGYTISTWETSDSFKEKKDDKTFLFSLNKNKLFRKVKLNERDIYFSSEYGLAFGNGDLYFRKTMKVCYSNPEYYFLINRELADNYNTNEIGIKEVEVYKIIFE